MSKEHVHSAVLSLAICFSAVYCFLSWNGHGRCYFCCCLLFCFILSMWTVYRKPKFEYMHCIVLYWDGRNKSTCARYWHIGIENTATTKHSHFVQHHNVHAYKMALISYIIHKKSYFITAVCGWWLAGWYTMSNLVVYSHGTGTSILCVLCCSLHLQIICCAIFSFVWKWLFSRKGNLLCCYSIHHQLSIPTSHAREPCAQSVLLRLVYISWKSIA